MIGIVGSGNLGANTAFFLAERAVDDVLLYDVQEGLATGKALDMMEAAPVRGYRTSVSGTDKLADLAEADIVVLAAGSIRSPGSKRSELFEENRAVIADTAAGLRNSSAKVIIAGEPVDRLTGMYISESGADPSRVLGVGGVLDTLRFRHFLARELGQAADTVACLVIGPHNEHMLPLKDYTSVSGLPVSNLLSDEAFQRAVSSTITAGDDILNMAGRANAYYGPAAAICDLAQSMTLNSKRIFSVSLMLDGQYGLSGACMSLPAVIGSEGIHRVLEPKLSEAEVERLKKAISDQD